jgi:hypothetical protein
MTSCRALRRWVESISWGFPYFSRIRVRIFCCCICMATTISAAASTSDLETSSEPISAGLRVLVALESS